MASRSFREAFARATQGADYWGESALLNFLAQIDSVMREHNISRAELARRLGTSPAYVTKVLRGNANLTHQSMAELAHAVGARIRIFVTPTSAREYTAQGGWIRSDARTSRARVTYRSIRQIDAANDDGWPTPNAA